MTASSSFWTRFWTEDTRSTFPTNPAGALVDGLIYRKWTANQTATGTQYGTFAYAESTKVGAPNSQFHSRVLTSIRTGLCGVLTWSRTIRRKTEETRWATPRLDIRFTQVSEAGELEGLLEVKQGRGLDVRPYASASWITNPGVRDSAQKDAGADVFLNITPSMKLTGTINTDFAETEVDNRQINLTRFPLFFPEKGAFFLENAGVFNFGAPPVGGAGGGTELLPFFSPRIGLVAGEEVPILAGLKLAGKAGRYDVGVLDIHTRESQRVNGLVEGLFSSRRVKRNIWTQSYIGGILQRATPTDGLRLVRTERTCA
jgi:hypothetical protein